MGTQKALRLSAGGAMRILRNQAGNIMPMAAIAMVALAGLVGGGVDVSRAYMIQNRLQTACDAGVLAGRKAVDASGFDANAQAEADTYFETNFDEANEGVTATSFTPTTTDNGSTIEGVASTTVDTAVMQLFGFDTIPLSVECTASMSVGNSDVMLVLDTTGSMGWDLDGTQTRMEALQDAMKAFYDTVAAASAGSNARIRYGFVPYSSSVNVGQLIYDANPGYLVDSWTYQSREAQYTNTEHQTVSGYEAPVYTQETGYSDARYTNWAVHSYTQYRRKSDCQDASPDNTAWADNGGTSTTTTQEVNSSDQRVTTTTSNQPQQRYEYTCYKYEGDWYILRGTVQRNEYVSDIATENPIYTTTTSSTFDHFDYKAVTYDTSVFKTFSSVSVPLGSGGSNITSSWAGCVEERDTVATDTFSWDSILGLTPSGAYDLDIDSAPDISDPATQWRPMWDDVSYYRTTDSSNSNITSAAVSDYGVKASSRCPIAARKFGAMSEAAFDAYADALNPSGSTYHNLGMVWGARLASPTGIWQDNVNEAPANGGAVARHIIFMTDGEMSPTILGQTSYGIEWHDRRVTDNGYSQHTARQNQRFLAACEATKAKGIRIWVIAFASNLTGDLVDCASDQSSFPAANAAQLNTAFQEIAKDVGELRITQ